MIQNKNLKKERKKGKTPRFREQNKLLFGALPLSPWVVSAMWLHIRAP
jgi:hypothetical protein